MKTVLLIVALISSSAVVWGQAPKPFVDRMTVRDSLGTGYVSMAWDVDSARMRVRVLGIEAPKLDDYTRELMLQVYSMRTVFFDLANKRVFYINNRNKTLQSAHDCKSKLLNSFGYILYGDLAVQRVRDTTKTILGLPCELYMADTTVHNPYLDRMEPIKLAFWVTDRYQLPHPTLVLPSRSILLPFALRGVRGLVLEGKVITSRSGTLSHVLVEQLEELDPRLLDFSIPADYTPVSCEGTAN